MKPRIGSRSALPALTRALTFLFLVFAPAALHAQDEALLAIRVNMPRVVLDRVVYEDGEGASATVTFIDIADVTDAFLALSFGAESSTDVEVVGLDPTADPLVYVTKNPILIKNDSGGAIKGDGALEIAPNEIFSALLSYTLSDRTQKPGDRAFSADWGILFDPAHADAKVEVRAGLALTMDELNPPAGLPPIGTLFFEGDVGPVQVASEELLFLPESDAQLTELINRTGAELLGYEGSLVPVTDPQDLPKAGTVWLRMKVVGDTAKIPQLAQLRSLVGETAVLSASNEATLALVATAMELWADGFLVGLNPRLQLQGDLYWPEGIKDGTRVDSFGNIGDNNPNVFVDGNFGIRQSWAFLAMFDFDNATIPVGVVDSGFAPNPDFKTSSPLYAETNLADGTTGIGSARTPQEVGNSFFGDKTWHGNGTVTTISGVASNRYGTAGIGGQTAVPKLYHMGLGNFAFGFGNAIRAAVNDGCSIVNISAGYPCRILSVLGNDNICSPGGRAAFTLKLGLAVRGAAAAVCAASPILDAFLPGLGVATCATAIAVAETAALGLFATVFLGEIRAPVERGVAFATQNGVPVVSSAGNRLTDDAIGPLGPFVNNENTNIDDWQIIPAVIPDVIAVGTCANGGWNVWNGDGNNHYANIHFWGDSVDVWAPFGTWYWAPESGTADPATVPVADHIRRIFGGTSNSAPIVSGVIANLMAINPALDRRFANPANLPNLPGQIRDLLVNTAHQAGDPAAPDSADDVVTLEFNPVTEMNEEIDEPPELLDQMMRRRNHLNAWAAVQQAASDAGVFDYLGFGYEPDLGRDDRHADVSAPDGVREPFRHLDFSDIEEISRDDVDFWFSKTPVGNNLYRFRYEVTIPLGENPANFLINRSPGTVFSTTADEQTLAWETRELFRDTFFPTTFSGQSGADFPYKVDATRITMALPPADTYDFGSASNETFATAPTIDLWENVTARGLLEVDAYEICLEDLNFHTSDDIDFYRIDFPEPPLNIPVSCSALDPWVTVRVEPANANIRIQVYSRSGGTDTLLARGNGSSTVRLDCRDYIGHLPLYVRIDSASGSFAEYDLKVRWSIPSAELGSRLDRIREANAGGREIPFFEAFFRPEVPWLFGSPGLLPDFLVNPNPALAQELDPEGRFLASRLFFIEVREGAGLNTEILATFGGLQSLRLELVGLDEQVVGFAATADLIGDPVDNIPEEPEGQQQQPFGDTQSLSLFFSDLAPGIYIIRLSGHRPGDQISLYLSQNLVTDGGLTIEDLFGIAGQTPPALIGFPPEFEAGLFSTSSLFPLLQPACLETEHAREIVFTAEALQGYQIEVTDSDDIWQPYGSPIVEEEAAILSMFLPNTRPQMEVRIAKLGDSGDFPPDFQGPATRLFFQSEPGVPYILTGSIDMDTDPWLPFGPTSTFTGTGDLFEWFFDAYEFPTPTFFFRVEESPFPP